MFNQATAGPGLLAQFLTDRAGVYRPTGLNALGMGVPTPSVFGSLPPQNAPLADLPNADVLGALSGLDARSFSSGQDARAHLDAMLGTMERASNLPVPPEYVPQSMPITGRDALVALLGGLIGNAIDPNRRAGGQFLDAFLGAKSHAWDRGQQQLAAQRQNEIRQAEAERRRLQDEAARQQMLMQFAQTEQGRALAEAQRIRQAAEDSRRWEQEMALRRMTAEAAAANNMSRAFEREALLPGRLEGQTAANEAARARIQEALSRIQFTEAQTAMLNARLPFIPLQEQAKVFDAFETVKLTQARVQDTVDRIAHRWAQLRQQGQRRYTAEEEAEVKRSKASVEQAIRLAESQYKSAKDERDEIQKRLDSVIRRRDTAGVTTAERNRLVGEARSLERQLTSAEAKLSIYSDIAREAQRMRIQISQQAISGQADRLGLQIEEQARHLLNRLQSAQEGNAGTVLGPPAPTSRPGAPPSGPIARTPQPGSARSRTGRAQARNTQQGVPPLNPFGPGYEVR